MFGYGQEGESCSELFMSEIVFGQQFDDFTSSSSFMNHTVEIYNPTDDPINLSTYSISLLSMDNQETYIPLQGYLQSGDVYVVSNTMANTEVATKTDDFHASLDFNDKKMIKLWHGATVIDKLGNSGDNIDNSAIDFDRLLNDAEYLNGLEVNLGTLNGLDIRRFVSVVVGNPDFVNSDFLLEWTYYPSFISENLGVHEGACIHGPYILWAGVIDKWHPEWGLEEKNGAVLDADGNIIAPATEFASRDVLLTEALTYKVRFSVFDRKAEFNDLGATNATRELDFLFDRSIFTFEPGETRVTMPKKLLFAINDNLIEGLEKRGMGLAVVEGAVGIDPEKKIWDGLIYDDDMMTSTDLVFRENLKVFPTVTSSSIFIEKKQQDIIINSILLFDVEGKLVKDYKDGLDQELLTLRLPEMASGYIFLVIKSNKGLFKK